MKKKTRNILLILYVFAFMMMLVGAAMAYFVTIKTQMISPSADVESATMSSIIFNAGEPLAIYVTPDNFAKGMENLTGQTYAEAVLKNGTLDVESTFHYNLSIELLNNTVVYSTNNKEPEVILTIIDPDGNPVKEIAGLEYVTYDGVSGFDITEKIGDYSVATNYKISTKNEITQRWETKLTIINKDTSQDINKRSGLEGCLKIEPVE